MRSANFGRLVELSTPKRFRLLGLWFGSPHAKRAIVFVHGLGGSVFSMRDLISELADQKTAVLAFNNRGAEIISKLRRSSSSRSILAGMTHEVFTDCVDDIQGAINFVRKQGAKNIFLAGHSTGSQKSVYWAYKRGGKGVHGIILLAPISDYSSTLKSKGKAHLARAERIARTLIRHGKRKALLPSNAWNIPIDAQRYMSLYSGDSAEEIFPYTQQGRKPRALRSIKKPLLVLLAEKDEHGDRPAKEIAAWFTQNAGSKIFRTVVVPRTNHGFKGAEWRVRREITHFMKKL